MCAGDELFELEGFPSVEQLQRYQQLAPASIAEAVGTVTEPLIAVGGDLVESFTVLADDEVEAAEAEMLAFEQNRCGSGHSDYMPLPAGATREIEPAAVRVDVHATEYAFQIGDVAPGRTSFVLVNDGAETHVLEIIKLADGVTFDDVLATEDHETTIAGLWETGLAAPGGDEEAVTFDLEPGQLRPRLLHPRRRRHRPPVPRHATRVHRPLTAPVLVAKKHTMKRLITVAALAVALVAPAANHTRRRRTTPSGTTCRWAIRSLKALSSTAISPTATPSSSTPRSP